MQWHNATNRTISRTIKAKIETTKAKIAQHCEQG